MVPGIGSGFTTAARFVSAASIKYPETTRFETSNDETSGKSCHALSVMPVLVTGIHVFERLKTRRGSPGRTRR
jgi:hypothetical protein